MKLLSFQVTDKDILDGVVTAYVKECILLAASELPKEQRGIVALAEALGTDRNKLSRWIDALNMREEIDEI